jgi:acyl-coenzyme A thioesterase PaaI-like protein
MDTNDGPSRSLSSHMNETFADASSSSSSSSRRSPESEPGGASTDAATATDVPAANDRPVDGPQSLDGVSGFMGMRWDDPQTIRLTIRPDLLGAGGLLSGVVTYALVDYCMGSTLWVQTTAEERIATINISINYIQTATKGEIVCRTELDRRNRSNAVMRSEVRHEDGRLLVSAIGSYTIFPARRSHTGERTR